MKRVLLEKLTQLQELRGPWTCREVLRRYGLAHVGEAYRRLDARQKLAIVAEIDAMITSAKAPQ